MKKNIIVFGMISGLIVAGLMVCITTICYNNPDYTSNMVMGYASMILAFSLVFVGVKNLRDKHSGGFISFGRAFKTGLCIAFIASTIYVVVWLIEYYLFIPDFMDKYTGHVLREARESGASSLDISKKTMEMARFKEMYKNPLFLVLITYSEILPIGIVVSLISALILKRKSKVLPTSTT